MEKIIRLIMSVFESRYTPYTLYKEKLVLIAETAEVPDPNEDYHTDPKDFVIKKTGRYFEIVRQVWVKYHKKTGLPKYKSIDLPGKKLVPVDLIPEHLK